MAELRNFKALKNCTTRAHGYHARGSVQVCTAESLGMSIKHFVDQGKFVPAPPDPTITTLPGKPVSPERIAKAKAAQEKRDAQKKGDDDAFAAAKASVTSTESSADAEDDTESLKTDKIVTPTEKPAQKKKGGRKRGPRKPKPEAPVETPKPPDAAGADEFE